MNIIWIILVATMLFFCSFSVYMKERYIKGNEDSSLAKVSNKASLIAIIMLCVATVVMASLYFIPKEKVGTILEKTETENSFELQVNEKLSGQFLYYYEDRVVTVDEDTFSKVNVGDSCDVEKLETNGEK